MFKTSIMVKLSLIAEVRLVIMRLMAIMLEIMELKRRKIIKKLEKRLNLKK